MGLSPYARPRLAGPLLVLLAVTLGACNLLMSPDAGGTQTTLSGVPLVQIAAPPPNASFLENVPVNIQALITNAGPDIDRVEIIVDGTIVNTLPTPNTSASPGFSIAQSWLAAGPGQHTISVVAFRADDSSSEPASVIISVVALSQTKPSATPSTSSQGSSQGGNNAQNPPTQAQPTQPPAPTQSAVPSASETPSKPTASFNSGVNVRSGPSTLFNPPIGSFAAGQTAEILARTPAGDWYKVRYYNGEGWVFGQLLTVAGDTAQIPQDAGPPIPTLTPIPPTVVPPTPVPVADVNLVAGNIRIDPGQPQCRQTFNIYFDVANFGTAASGGGSISVVDVFPGDPNLAERTFGAFGPIQPGQTANIGPIPITVSVYFEQDHKLTLVVDNDNRIAESNEGDNTREFTYRLGKGGC